MHIFPKSFSQLSVMLVFTAPTVPRSLKAISNSSSVLVIHWNAPATPNGNVTHYVVKGTWERDDQKFLEQRNYCSERKPKPLDLA